MSVPASEFVAALIERLLDERAAEQSPRLRPEFRLSSIHREQYVLIVTLADRSVVAVRCEALHDGAGEDG